MSAAAESGGSHSARGRSARSGGRHRSRRERADREVLTCIWSDMSDLRELHGNTHTASTRLSEVDDRPLLAKVSWGQKPFGR